MTVRAETRSRFASRWFWIAVAVAIALVVAAANVHLVYVSLTSQPACVPHLQAPDHGGTTYRAAKSAC
ncbi:hypothetical protein [Citreimonas salinaria]|uniref:Uncharacterized protein n=1 Tax=Citreimonas salinaria TaxID=321339 RepID=A0A1H3NRH8_9RHOB|nr:hypothetical protein [Citreimonas salinaria]SDY91290.1 hypothetical protein SAMN05444340_1294 [Citreimonas salinaria]